MGLTFVIVSYQGTSSRAEKSSVQSVQMHFYIKVLMKVYQLHLQICHTSSLSQKLNGRPSYLLPDF